MNNMELLHRLQNECIVVRLHINMSGDRDTDISKDLRQTITGKMRELRTLFEDNSIPFGERMLVVDRRFEGLIVKASGIVAEVKKFRQHLTPAQSEKFSSSFEYEPVPNSSGFNMLPEKFRAALAAKCDERNVDNFYDGMHVLDQAIYKAADFFVARVGDYHEFQLKPDGLTKSVLRGVVHENFVKLLSLLHDMNLARSDKYAPALKAAGMLSGLTIDGLRSSSEKRDSALQVGRMVRDQFKAMIDAEAE